MRNQSTQRGVEERKKKKKDTMEVGQKEGKIEGHKDVKEITQEGNKNAR